MDVRAAVVGRLECMLALRVRMASYPQGTAASMRRCLVQGYDSATNDEAHMRTATIYSFFCTTRDSQSDSRTLVKLRATPHRRNALLLYTLTACCSSIAMAARPQLPTQDDCCSH